jgi:DNA repair protein RecN (Recombination protein N)
MRLEQVQERLSMLQTLMKKHHVQTIEELIALRDQLAEQVQRLENMDEEIEQLRTRSMQAKHAAEQAATVLTQSRQSVCDKIAAQLVADMQRLGVPHAKVAVDIQPLDDFTETGKDNVQFLFAANLNQSLRRVAEVASGGEISRLMLCIKALIASTKGLPTIIFDEIDTGISGKTSRKVGIKLKELSRHAQVICVTHSAQIASLADTHIKISKNTVNGRAETSVKVLTDDERIEEIARILGGINITESQKNTASELISEGRKLYK